MRLFIPLIFIFFFNQLALASESSIKWHHWSKQTFQQAADQDKLVLVDLTADWCVYCQKMKKVTYRDQAVVDEINQHYIAIVADEAEFPQVAKRFSNIGRPGTIILNADGKKLEAKSGYLKPQWMLWMLQAVAQRENP